MEKIYIVRLSESERVQLFELVTKLKGSSQKVRRANILLKADVDGPNWTDHDIAEAFFCTRQCVENLRKRFVTEGFEVALNSKPREFPPRRKVLGGRQEAALIALRLSETPKGYNGWTVRLLAEKVVELGIVQSVSRTTVHRTLKKTK
ncbi:MAG: helix-turn-helix domain-containing protein [Planctomycetaceae bacterium]|nr:helix-turn-helix domain-containing protein [Planctomycetaceae bacterium]